jgi:hypothetical protein
MASSMKLAALKKIKTTDTSGAALGPAARCCASVASLARGPVSVSMPVR